MPILAYRSIFRQCISEQRWEFIKENKKVRKQEKRCFRPRKRKEKKENTLSTKKAIKKKRKKR